MDINKFLKINLLKHLNIFSFFEIAVKNYSKSGCIQLKNAVKQQCQKSQIKTVKQPKTIQETNQLLSVLFYLKFWQDQDGAS